MEIPTKVKEGKLLANLFRKFSLGLVFVLLFLPACLPVGKKPYAQKKYYRKTLQAINSLSVFPVIPDTIKVGWAKVNITPTHKAPLAGYGKRKGKRLEGIHDSIYIRAFVFKNKTQKAAYVTMDLLISPMSVTAQLKEELIKIGFSENQVYLTATHSHSSLGGWARKPAGYLMAGKYDKKIVANLTKAIITVLQKAEKNASPTQIGYKTVEASGLVRNRLVGEKGTLDALVRIVKFKKQNGETAVLTTYAAHATCLPAAELSLSGDYPGKLVQILENDSSLRFAAFSAGSVGSHSPTAPGDGFIKVDQMAGSLSRLIKDELEHIAVAYQFKLHSLSVPLYLRTPHWRIAENVRLYPALFNLVFGKYPAVLKGLRVGQLLFIGTPCDFSGELIPGIEKQLKSPSENVIITSFNGGYIGYITPDNYYNLKKYETRDMNLFGPYNGAYLTEMITRLLHKL